MGTYYHLLNDTKRESVHLDNHIKHGPITSNPAVHFALCNYMMGNLGDALRLSSDTFDDGEDYTDVDLLAYKFNEPSILPQIVELLNSVYGREKYVVVGGIGVERA